MAKTPARYQQAKTKRGAQMLAVRAAPFVLYPSFIL
jgi:hypothetical protein